ncbi:hypothetical protein D7294_02805 [Streptomyces hoynatensis]|uniref:Tryptophan 2,3-dioxygenase n=2 Tax=Streptomyces hoynatensis TaxID=1141874 RepID=A0A3A9ZHY4_9ACTN|nr:hypothetical protein D7294_02805 [Streptomyces hoynatensis]
MAGVAGLAAPGEPAAGDRAAPGNRTGLPDARDAGGPGGPREPAELGELAEALLEHDAVWAEWRAAHVLLVERQIGGLPGTGGSSGVSHLRGAMHRRFYPELWEVAGGRAPAAAVSGGRGRPGLP